MNDAVHGLADGFASGDDPSGPVSAQPLALRIENLKKIYGSQVDALNGVSLEVGTGEFVTLLGPSGSGKTTLLMSIAGFVMPTSGSIFSSAGDITALPPQKRNFGIVFQSYALFPHMSVRSNVSYPLSVRGIRGTARREMVDEALALVDLEGYAERKPAELSGGQQQRVALARALVYKPSLLLLDEPLGALDRSLRERMQVELRNLHRKLGVTFLYVTHDQDEALRMSDRIVVLRRGLVEQIGTPADVYARPGNEFVARFLGEANLLPVDVVGAGSQPGAISCRLPTGDICEIASNCPPGPMPARALLLVRPDRVRVGASADAPALPGDPGRSVTLPGTITDIAFSGTTWRYDVHTPHGDLRAAVPAKIDAPVGGAATVTWDLTDSWAIAN